MQPDEPNVVTGQVIDAAVIVELKAVEKLAENHEAQLLTSSRPGRFTVGLLINFNERRLRDGMRRRVNAL